VSLEIPPGQFLAVMRLASGTRGRTPAVIICEALVVTETALVAGAAVARTTLRRPPVEVAG
jgi:hypothetical protein